MIKVGIIGLGGMGGVHFSAYQANSQAQIVAVCDVDEAKLQGGGTQLNIGGGAKIDLSGVKTYSSADELLNDADVQLVDICLPTSLHAQHAIKALAAGKHVFCEKPIALTTDEAAQMAAAQESSGQQLMIGHCLRYWPQYLKAHEIIESGEHGKVVYARFHRSGATPTWSWDGWLQDGARSGGAVLDMHIHDVDTAIWWFGVPVEIRAAGYVVNDLPMSVDATWHYKNGPLVYLHGSWDDNGGPFRMSYKVVLEKATIEWDSSKSDAVLLHKNGETQEFTVSAESAYQAEIDDFVACLSENRPMTRITPQGSRETLEVVLEELRQIQN